MKIPIISNSRAGNDLFYAPWRQIWFSVKFSTVIHKRLFQCMFSQHSLISLKNDDSDSYFKCFSHFSITFCSTGRASKSCLHWMVCDKVAGRDEMREMSDVIIINEVRCDTSFQYICRQWRHYNFKKHAIILIFFYLELSS